MRRRRRSFAVLAALAAVPALTGIVPAAGAQPAAPFVTHGGALPVAGESASGAPRVAMDRANRTLVVWTEAAGPEGEPRWRARRFDAAGVALSPPVDLAGAGVVEPLVGGVSDLSMNPDGRWAIAWTDGDGVFVRRFSPAGEPEGEATRVDLGQVPAGTELLAVERPVVALAADGSGLVLWVQRLRADDLDPSSEVLRLVSRRFAAGGPPQGDEVERAVWVMQGFAFHGTYDAAFDAAGDAVLATVRQTGDPAVTRLSVVLLPAGGGTVPLAAAGAVFHPSEENPRVAADGTGSFAVAFDDTGGQGPDGADGSCSAAYVRFHAADGTPLGPERRVHRETLGCQGLIGIAGLAGGGWLVAWAGAPADPHLGVDGSREGLWLTTYDAAGEEVGAPVRLPAVVGDARPLPDLAAGAGLAVVAEQRRGLRLHRAAPAGIAICPPAALPGGALCLGAGRWRVDARWRDPYNGGPVGDGSPRRLVADTGAVWFFEPGNLELLVKVLDGRPVNGHWWVFHGALTTVEYWLDVTDVATGRQSSYWNPPFVQASRADTRAFIGDAAAPAHLSTAAPRPPSAPPAAGSELAGVSEGPPPERPVAGIDLAPGPPATRARRAADEASEPCGDAATTLCLHDRFALEISWRDPRSGDAGEGTAVPIDGSSGAFWFFHPANLELLVKVLDGRPVNGHWWVFHGGLSDVEYTLTVTDTLGGSPVTYRSPPFELTGGADTAAFPDRP